MFLTAIHLIIILIARVIYVRRKQMTNIGQFNKIGVLQITTPTRTPTGGSVDVWTNQVTNVWGYLSKLSGIRSLDSGELQMSRQWIWITWLQSAVDSVNKKKARWVIDSKNFIIADYGKANQKGELDERGKFHRFLLNEAE